LDINPKYVTAINYLALSHFFLKHNDIAIKLLKKALAINPNFVMGWKNLAEVYYNINKFQEAINAYTRILEIEPNNVQTLVELAKIYISKLDDLNLALELLEKAKKINENHAETWYQIGMIYFKRSEKLKAEKCFNKAIELDPNMMLKVPNLFL